jgi:hypothetical protein
MNNMILKGRQIFSHLEGKVNIASYFYTLAVRHAKEHPRKVFDCIKCELFFSKVPPNFGSRSFDYEVIVNPKFKSHKFELDYDTIEIQRVIELEKLIEDRRQSKALKLTFSIKRK